jgi:formylglycine-generating enzyme required for sulfatase activity
VGEMFKPEGPVHEVHIRYEFSVSKYPITRREWKQFVKETRHHDSARHAGLIDDC